MPIELLDVAGLVPGAHEGKGLGNKFLDDLRHADALVHVVDVSGTTDAEGKSTRGYDPSQDIVWLRSEIVQWIRGNLMQKWGSIKRRHVAVKATAVETLQGQFSGYGSTAQVVARTLDKLALKEPLEHWSDATIDKVVNAFTDEKFPTVIALNKIDHADADKNISKIAKMQDPKSIVLCSAISEVFLRKLAKQGFIRYVEGSEFVDTREDLIADGDPDGGGLKEMDEKLKTRIENLKDMVLYRFGSTGVVQVLSRAAELLGLVPVFPVRNVTSFSSGASGSNAVFRDCVLVKKNTTVAEVARKVMGDAPLAFVEGMWWWGLGGVFLCSADAFLITPQFPRVMPLCGLIIGSTWQIQLLKVLCDWVRSNMEKTVLNITDSEIFQVRVGYEFLKMQLSRLARTMCVPLNTPMQISANFKFNRYSHSELGNRKICMVCYGS